MASYFNKSFDKFKQDALSKVFYDTLKWLIPSTIAFAASNYLPTSTSVGQFLSEIVKISIYSILLFFLSTISLTTLIITIVFNKKYKTIRNNAFTDELTGLKNHKAFKEFVNEKIVDCNKSNKTFSIIIIDIDGFKSFNSQYNTNTADNILSKLGEFLGNDKRVTDEVFRQFLRGDEFVIVASETNLNDAYKAAERKRNLINQTSFSVGENSYKLTVSCGVTEFKKIKDDYVSLTDRANQALVEAKSVAGKNTTKTII